MLRQILLTASRSDNLKKLSVSAPVARDVVGRFVAGEATGDAVRTVAGLADTGLLATVDHLGEDTTDRHHAEAVRDAYLELLAELVRAGLAASAEASVKLSAIGQSLPGGGQQIATENAHAICAAASAAGTCVTLDMEDHTTIDSTLETLRMLREDFPETGAVLQSYLCRTEGDCRDLATSGSRVRLVKGAYAEPASVAFQSRAEVDLNYVRCLKVLLAGDGYPMVATHDPRLVEIALTLADRQGRSKDSFELQMLYGIRPAEQARLAGLGHRMRVYLPYGTDWYGYLVRRLAEKPANLRFFARSLVSRR